MGAGPSLIRALSGLAQQLKGLLREKRRRLAITATGASPTSTRPQPQGAPANDRTSASTSSAVVYFASGICRIDFSPRGVTPSTRRFDGYTAGRANHPQIHVHRLCVAPMMDWTDRHCRYFLRQVSSGAFLYTEMITTGALLHGDVERHLAFNDEEHPVAAQLGGSEPADLAQCAKLVEQYGYDEVNLNIGCPSERVQRGAFGACLMAEPELVADCVRAMREAVKIPVTVKHRLGINKDGVLRFRCEFRGESFQSRLHDVHRARPQRSAERPVAEGKPRSPAAQVRLRLPPEAGLSCPGIRVERRNHARTSPIRTSTASCSAARPITTPGCWRMKARRGGMW